MNHPITKGGILAMSYTDFVGFVNQWNVPPGAYSTLSKWAIFSRLDSNSNLLEMACTSGFSSRELSIMTGCRGTGLDISKPSLEMATHNKEQYAPQVGIKYVHADGDLFSPGEKFSHVVVGAALKFFPRPEETLKTIISSHLQDGGILLASPFYVTRDVPDELIEKAKGVFGIRITTEKYHDVMRMYAGFEVLYEDRCSIEPETPEELEHYCASTIERAASLRGVADPEVKEVMYKRLMDIKIMSNELRPYQMYSVLVLRYRSQIYPARYTELF